MPFTNFRFQLNKYPITQKFEESAEAAGDLVNEKLIGEEGGPTSFTSWVALSTMILALLSAVGAMLAGITDKKALIE